jgi:hypothetical protein
MMSLENYYIQLAQIIAHYWLYIDNLENAILMAHQVIEQENNCFINISKDDITVMKDLILQ